MSNRIHLNRAGRAGIAIAVGLALAGVPAAAHGAPVDLATAGPFAVLGGQTVTNTGASVLNGDLGVAPGTALPGFGTATVNGAIHANDAVAKQAQLDLTTAYDVAAGQAVTQDLTGTDLGNRTLKAGVYRYSSSAQLTNTLTLDAENKPDAQFVFQIGSALTTAPSSSVVLINGASPCNIFWQVTSSATLDTGTAFKGNVLALTSIWLRTGALVQGRVLARNGEVTLQTNAVDRSMCAARAATAPAVPANDPAATAPTQPDRTPMMSSARAAWIVTPHGRITMRRLRGGCDDGFRATVRGRMIKRVVFSLDGRRIASQVRSPFRVFVRARPGAHKVRARVTFKDSTRARTLTLPYRACASAVLRPRPGPSQFTG